MNHHLDLWMFDGCNVVGIVSDLKITVVTLAEELGESFRTGISPKPVPLGCPAGTGCNRMS